MKKLNITKTGNELDQVLSALTEMYELQVQVYDMISKHDVFHDNVNKIFRNHFGNGNIQLALDDPDRSNKLDSFVTEVRTWNTRQQNRQKRDWAADHPEEYRRHVKAALESGFFR